MRKAGFIELGEDAAIAAVKLGKAKLLLLSADASETARGRAEASLAGHRALLIELPYTKDELAEVVGLAVGTAAVTDLGLAAAFIDALAAEEPEKYLDAAGELGRRKEKAARRKAAGPKLNRGGNRI